MQNQNYFLIIPEDLANHPEAQLLDIKIYGNIARLKGGCFASYDTLALWVNCSKRSVFRSVSKLVELGFLEKKNGKLVVSTGYISDLNVTKSDICVTEECHLGHQNGDICVTKEVTSGSHTINRSFINIKDKYSSIKGEASLAFHPRSNLSFSELPNQHQNTTSTLAFGEWLDYRASAKLKKWVKATELSALKKFTTSQELQEAVKHSISNGYQGLFSPNKTNGSYKTQFDRNHETIMQSLAEIEREKGVA
jgi:hypothetical protein